jgi:hypothetical protein
MKDLLRNAFFYFSHRHPTHPTAGTRSSRKNGRRADKKFDIARMMTEKGRGGGASASKLKIEGRSVRDSEAVELRLGEMIV